MQNRIRFAAFILILLLGSSPTILRADSAEKCAERLAEAHEKPRRLDILKELRIAAKRCKKEPVVQLEVAHLYMELKDAAGEHWLQEALAYFAAAFEADDRDLQARWHLANAYAYLGEYECAIPHYQWLKQEAVPAEARRAGAYLATCVLLASLPDRDLIDPAEKARSIASHLDLADSVRVRRAEWHWIRALCCAGVLAARKHEQQTLEKGAQVAVCYLHDWIKEPFAEDVDRRIELLTGMLGMLTREIVKRELEQEVAAALQSSGRRGPVEWPDTSILGSAALDFSARRPDTLRHCRFTDSLTVEYEWRRPDLCGYWNCHVVLAPLDGTPDRDPLDFKVEIKQAGDSVFLLMPEIEHEFKHPSRLTLLLDGWELSTAKWEQFATVTDLQYFELEGKLRLAEDYSTLNGLLGKYVAEVGILVRNWYWSVRWSETAGQYTLTRL